ncbi:methionine ABC transporter permease [Agrococcus casei]|uniref:methionine ABC transporter permease n=1 Tax=Agrococcus casei TaxID=343512 RepID=UPI003F93C926
MDGLDKLIDLMPQFLSDTGKTFYIVGLSMLFGGVGGLIIGTTLYVTRSGGVLANRAVQAIAGFVVNFFRPIPFLIFIAVAQPLARVVVGTGIGDEAAIVAISVAASFGIGRIVEQNLVSVDPGVIEAARAMGAGPWRIIRTVILPEAFGPLILGYTFATIAVIDMSAVAGFIGSGGLGNFAIVYGYRQYNDWATWAAVLIIVIIVSIVQALGNAWSRKVMRR